MTPEKAKIMNESKHTKGPWQIAEYGNIPIKGHLAIKQGAKTVCTIQVSEGFGLTPDIVSDARLIAAAPELMAALETCVQAFGAASTASADSWTVQCDRAEQQARAALAKGDQ